MNIGICGGTFDPFHCGHLEPVLAVRVALRWDRVLYVPAFMQPFKTGRAAVSPFHRFAMTVVGTEGHEGLFVSSRELERGAVSYTVDTLEELRSEHPDVTLDWIIGDDNLAQLTEWKSIERVLELANFAVLTRLSGAAEALGAVPPSLRGRVVEASARPAHGAIVFAGNATVPASSTEVRRRIRAGEPIDTLVPPAVSRYIHHYELYRKGPS